MNEQTKRVFTEKQLALIEKHRDWNTNYDWWEYVYEDWAEKLKAMGIDIDNKPTKLMNGKTRYDPAIYFSGFWSQGDGACFEGRLDMEQFIKANGLHKDYPAATYIATKGEMYCSVTHHGHYNHSGCTQFDFSWYLGPDEENEVRGAIDQAMIDEFIEGEGSFEETIKDICRGYMDDIYEALELEYDYLTSDEAVWEAIEANELDKEIEDDEEDEEVLAHAA